MRLKEHILSLNSYFAKGYDNAFIQGGVFCHEGRDLKQIFPNDNKGNYFYIRKNGSTEYSKIGEKPIIYQDRERMSVICIVNDANPNILISNIRSTLLNFGDIDVTGAEYEREVILISELKGIGKDKIQHALQRLKSETIVKVDFTLFSTFVASNCKILNPCENGCLY